MQRKALDTVETDTDAPKRAHITLKAVTTVGTDEGTFTAIISTESVDRELDIVDASAMSKALGAWGAVGKLIPLAWQHSPKAEDQIGHIKPETVEVKAGKVIGDGWIDQSTDRGQHAWRLVKSGTLGFSFGYLMVAGTKRQGGGYHITELDVFEVSATPTPMNHDTRVLAWKSAEELREAAKDVAHAVEDSLLPAGSPEPSEPGVDVPKELQEVKAMLAEMGDQIAGLTKKVEETDQETKSRSVDPLQDQAMKAALGVLSSGAKAPKVDKEEPKPQPEQEPEELFKASHDLMVRVLSGATTD